MKLAEAVTLYISLRDKKTKIVEEHKASIKPLDDKMSKLECLLLKAMQDNGLQSANSPDGTAYIATRSSVTTADKEVFMQHVKAHQAWDLLEVRPSKEGVLGYQLEHGDIPPGVNVRVERVVNVRRTS